MCVRFTHLDVLFYTPYTAQNVNTNRGFQSQEWLGVVRRRNFLRQKYDGPADNF